MRITKVKTLNIHTKEVDTYLLDKASCGITLKKGAKLHSIINSAFLMHKFKDAIEVHIEFLIKDTQYCLDRTLLEDGTVDTALAVMGGGKIGVLCRDDKIIPYMENLLGCPLADALSSRFVSKKQLDRFLAWEDVRVFPEFDRLLDTIEEIDDTYRRLDVDGDLIDKAEDMYDRLDVATLESIDKTARELETHRQRLISLKEQLSSLDKTPSGVYVRANRDYFTAKEEYDALVSSHHQETDQFVTEVVRLYECIQDCAEQLKREKAEYALAKENAKKANLAIQRGVSQAQKDIAKRQSRLKSMLSQLEQLRRLESTYESAITRLSPKKEELGGRRGDLDNAIIDKVNYVQKEIMPVKLEEVDDKLTEVQEMIQDFCDKLTTVRDSIRNILDALTQMGLDEGQAREFCTKKETPVDDSVHAREVDYQDALAVERQCAEQLLHKEQQMAQLFAQFDSIDNTCKERGTSAKLLISQYRLAESQFDARLSALASTLDGLAEVLENSPVEQSDIDVYVSTEELVAQEETNVAYLDEQYKEYLANYVTNSALRIQLESAKGRQEAILAVKQSYNDKNLVHKVIVERVRAFVKNASLFFTKLCPQYVLDWDREIIVYKEGKLIDISELKRWQLTLAFISLVLAYPLSTYSPSDYLIIDDKILCDQSVMSALSRLDDVRFVSDISTETQKETIYVN